MNRVLYLTITAALALAGGADALAAATASGTAGVTIVDRVASIDVVSPLVLPTVTATAITPVTAAGAVGPAVGAATGGATNGSGNAAAPTGNATLTIHGQAGDAVSMAVPETFKVVRTGGTEALTVKTSTNMEYDVGGNGVVLGGSLNADTMSVNVGGALSLASADRLVPGPYEGLLVVVVQYN
jgi:hypothetical protein